MGSAPRPFASRRSAGCRPLVVELLEDRRLLDAGSVVPEVATPWHNAARPLDVNNDGKFSTLDALAVIDRMLTMGTGPLPADPQEPHDYYDTNGDNILSATDALWVINELLAPPSVTLTSLVPFSIDRTPQLTVTAYSNVGLPPNAQASIDVDLNGDGDFTDPGEADYMTVPLSNGAATFDLAPALPPSGPDGPYTINVQARISDARAVPATSAVLPLVVDTSTSTALADYVNTPDATYQYSLASTTVGSNDTYRVYDLNMTSQTWRSTDDVNQSVWQHWMQIVVPSRLTSTTALLLIDGGSNGGGPPAPDSTLTSLALESGTVVVDLQEIPNEPLTFTGDPNNPRSEDDAIAYTFNEFMQNLGQPGDQTWPLLLPMVKAAVRGMDTVQNFVPTVSANNPINDFVVTGYSKRGWTTWLTAAVDPRVKAIIPGVFDALNLAEQMVHHYGVYGFFSPAIQPYNAEQIFDRILTPAGEALSAIVDPYRYLSESQMSMPKLLLDSSGDQFFVSDSAQYYFHDLPGTQNYLRYIPNTGHGLDSRADDSTVTFYNAIINNLPLPQYSWTVEPDGAIRAVATTHPMQVLLWQATNPTARDFRQGYTNVVWTSTVMFDEAGGVYTADPPTPPSGATAYFIEMTFPSPIPGNPYVFTTEIRVKTNLPLYAWPYASEIPVGTVSGVPNVDLNGIASGLAATFATSTTSVAAGLPPLPVATGAAQQNQASQSTVLMTAATPGDQSDDSAADALTVAVFTEDPTELVFANSLDDVLGA